MDAKIIEAVGQLKDMLKSHIEQDAKRHSDLFESQIRMEEDIRHHIKRTDQNEMMLKPMWKAYIGIRWSIGAILCLGALAAAIGRFKGLL